MRAVLLLALVCVCGCATSGEAELRAQAATRAAELEKRNREISDDANRQIGAAITARQSRRDDAGRRQIEESARMLSQQRREATTLKVETVPDNRCATELNYSSCVSTDETCKAACKEAIDIAAAKIVRLAIDRCSSLYLGDEPPAAPGPECALDLPAKADPKGDGSGISAETRAKLNLACTEACRSEGAEVLASAKQRERAAREGKGLSLAFKRCMLAVDSSREALRYKLYDSDLYQDLMQKTDARCRVASRCDWLEKYSDEFACAYGD